MRAHVKIIVEQQSADHWTAWLEDYPCLSAGGEWPADAIKRLLLTFGTEEFATEEITSIDEGTRDGHLEFRMPLNRLQRIPRPSTN